MDPITLGALIGGFIITIASPFIVKETKRIEAEERQRNEERRRQTAQALERQARSSQTRFFLDEHGRIVER